MKDRIRAIMENEQLTPSAFADMLDIGRAVVSHILNGRNNPSLDVVTRILSKLPYINPEWLLSGEGTMYKDGIEPEKLQLEMENNFSSSNRNFHQPKAPDLFSQTSINPIESTEKNEYRKETIVEQSDNTLKNAINQQIIYQKAPDKKIAKIIIYYSDNTFEVFNADNRPL